MAIARLHGGPLDGQLLPLENSDLDRLIVPYSETQVVYVRKGDLERTGENDGPTEGVIYLEGQALREHEVCCWLLAAGFECLLMNSADIDRLGRRHRDALQVSCRLFVFYEAHYQTTGVDSLFQTTSSLLLPHRMRRPGLQLLVRYRR